MITTIKNFKQIIGKNYFVMYFFKGYYKVLVCEYLVYRS